MIDIDKYEGHNKAPWRTAEGQPYDDEGSHLDIVDANGVLVTETSYFTDNDHPNAQLIADAPLLLAEVKRLQYLEKYAPTFQVFAQKIVYCEVLEFDDVEEETYTQHGSLKECEEHIAAFEDGWIGRIEVIEYYVPTNNPQVKTLEEWRNEE